MRLAAQSRTVQDSYQNQSIYLWFLKLVVMLACNAYVFAQPGEDDFVLDGATIDRLVAWCSS